MRSREPDGARRVDRSSRIPYYYQLQEILKEGIEHGTWRPGELLPSEGAIERQFGVSRTVVRQALDVLQADGQIRRVKGKGSIVCEPKFRWGMTTNARDWYEAGAVVQVRIGGIIDQRRVPAGALVGRVLEMADADLVFELTFTQVIDQQAVALSQMYLRPAASPLLETLLLADSPPAIVQDGGENAAVQLARRYGVRPTSSHATVELTSVNDFEANVLRVPQRTPAFLVAALERDATDAPVAFTRTVLRADRARISVTSTGDHDSSVELTGLSLFVATRDAEN